MQFRRGQVLMLQQDLAGARNAFDDCRRLGGDNSALRGALAKLKQLEKAERAREAALYGGQMQGTSLHQAEEAQQAVRIARRETMWSVVYVLAFPLILPLQLLQRGMSALASLLSQQLAPALWLLRKPKVE